MLFRSLGEVFEYIKKSGKRCIIAIDEFQQILEYPEKGVEALLRSYSQFAPNAGFVFAGSKDRLMREMFSTAKRPFYQSAENLILGEIPQDIYRKFAKRLFAKAERELSDAAFDLIYTALFGHTWYVQSALNRAYAFGKKLTNEQVAREALDAAIENGSATYKLYCETLPKGQLAVLRAIAAEGTVAAPTSGKFIARHSLGAASSVRQAIAALSDKTFVLRGEDGAYSVGDRFFGLWLASSL